jgi:hypothetical protein
MQRLLQYVGFVPDPDITAQTNKPPEGGFSIQT